jgi:Protein of unknown function (DUF3572)
MAKPAYSARDVAETVAISALSYLTADPEKLGRFLVETGLGPQNLRKAAEEPHFLAAVLDFMLRDDKLTVEFAKAHSLKPETVAAARDALGPTPWDLEGQ